MVRFPNHLVLSPVLQQLIALWCNAALKGLHTSLPDHRLTLPVRLLFYFHSYFTEVSRGNWTPVVPCSSGPLPGREGPEGRRLHTRKTSETFLTLQRTGFSFNLRQTHGKEYRFKREVKDSRLHTACSEIHPVMYRLHLQMGSKGFGQRQVNSVLLGDYRICFQPLNSLTSFAVLWESRSHGED